MCRATEPPGGPPFVENAKRTARTDNGYMPVLEAWSRRPSWPTDLSRRLTGPEEVFRPSTAAAAGRVGARAPWMPGREAKPGRWITTQAAADPIEPRRY